MERLKSKIRDVPDFPQKGIIFKDITTLLKDRDAFKQVVNAFVKRYRRKKIDLVVAVEARGFILGAALAHRLGVGIIPVRKKGKLPYRTHKIKCRLEYGQAELEVHRDAIKPKEKILLVDDLLATGGTVAAVCKLIEKMKGKIVEIAFLVELTGLKGRKKLKYPIHSLIKY
ncbi:MAG: adenine phosphoribosyltransferase [Candidatus Ratteibacteria bacterium]|nr:adenine phosphoribosyltransferase [Candidatus Ratteibacteria bacterium]